MPSPVFLRFQSTESVYKKADDLKQWFFRNCSGLYFGVSVDLWTFLAYLASQRSASAGLYCLWRGNACVCEMMLRLCHMLAILHNILPRYTFLFPTNTTLLSTYAKFHATSRKSETVEIIRKHVYLEMLKLLLILHDLNRNSLESSQSMTVSLLVISWLIPGCLLILIAHDEILLPDRQRRAEAGRRVEEGVCFFRNVDQRRLEHLLHLHHCCGLQAPIPHIPHPGPDHWGRGSSAHTVNYGLQPKATSEQKCVSFQVKAISTSRWVCDWARGKDWGPGRVTRVVSCQSGSYSKERSRMLFCDVVSRESNLTVFLETWWN